MSFASFCLWHLFDVQARLRAFEQARARGRVTHEREAERARWSAQLAQERW